MFQSVFLIFVCLLLKSPLYHEDLIVAEDQSSLTEGTVAVQFHNQLEKDEEFSAQRVVRENEKRRRDALVEVYPVNQPSSSMASRFYNKEQEVESFPRNVCLQLRSTKKKIKRG